MTKKIPISFNNENLADIDELIDLMGMANVYGDFPKAVKFGIKLAVSAIKNPGKVYSDLNDSEMAIYLQSIERAERKTRKLRQAEKLRESAKKV